MLVHSNKPQIIRLHGLQQKQRIKFCSDFNVALTELLSSSANRKLKSSLFLTKLVSAIPDIFYTLVTLYYCKRRLGEEYTYIAMYKEKHFNQQGVLLNKKTRLLMFILEIVSRNFIIPLFSRLMDPKSSAFEANTLIRLSSRQKFLERMLKVGIKIKQGISKYLGNAQQIMSNVQWFILMVYMLDWNKHFTFIETLLGIRYVYTYKNEQIREVSYAIQGYLLLVTFIVKAIKNLYSFLKSKNKKAQSSQNSSGEINIKEPMQPKGGGSAKQNALCRICYDDIKNKSSTKCGHVFCWPCIIQTLQLSQQCPVCRRSCQPREVTQLRNI